MASRRRLSGAWGRSKGKRQKKRGICNLLNAIYASGKAKVADNYFITTGEEDVLSFEVSVDDLVLVQVAQGRSHLEEYLSRPRLWIFTLEYLRSEYFLS